MLCNLDLDFNTAVKRKIYDVVVVGAGQAGLSISYFLSKSKIDHVVLDQGKIGNAWVKRGSRSRGLYFRPKGEA